MLEVRHQRPHPVQRDLQQRLLAEIRGARTHVKGFSQVAGPGALPGPVFETLQAVPFTSEPAVGHSFQLSAKTCVDIQRGASPAEDQWSCSWSTRTKGKDLWPEFCSVTMGSQQEVGVPI